jgi:hypothetical protein
MSKTVTFTSEVWGGSVTFHDPLTLEQEAAWEYAVSDFQKAREKGGGLSAQTAALIPALDACIEKWELKGFPERITLANFPMRPKDERARLLAWLVTNITELYSDSMTVPNA